MKPPAPVRMLVRIAVVLATVPVQAASAADPSPPPVTVKLNGVEIALDASSGSILRMSRGDVGTVLDTTPDCASIVDLAYPIERFEPLRLASRFSQGAKIATSEGRAVIGWDRLGASRDFRDLAGRVAATVTLQAASDGQSLVLTCRVENLSEVPVRQVLFPDLLGLVPLGTAVQTEFRTGPVVSKPFVSLARPVEDQFYAVNSTYAEYTSNGKDPAMAGRWMDLSGPKGGTSLFPKRSVWETGPLVMLQYWEPNRRLRWMCSHYVNLAKGAKWESPEYWLTPHAGNWEQGVAPYRAWCREQGKAK